MNTHRTNVVVRIGLAAVVLFTAGATARSADKPTLKDTFKDYFLVGVAINRTIATSSDVRADNVNRNMEQVNKDAALVVEQYNQISPENDLKWQLIQPREGADGYNFGPADAYVDFGVRHNMYIVGHTLVWHGQTPNWVFQGDAPTATETQPAQPAADAQPAAGAQPAGDQAPRRGRRGFGGRGGFTGPRATREQLLERMRDHIHTVVGRYKGKIKTWDVVNEALADGGGGDVLRNSLWLQIVGPDFIAKAFEYAHEADPDATLRYNDYGLENAQKRPS